VINQVTWGQGQNWLSRSLGFFLPPPASAYMQHGVTLSWLPTASCRSSSSLLYIRLCQSRCLSREPSFTLSASVRLTSFSLDMIKGNAPFFQPESDRGLLLPRVMSGVITGPHFRKYFNSPGPVEVGTMVAVLEIGAFSASPAFFKGHVSCVI
jgi:hypothetical protein